MVPFAAKLLVVGGKSQEQPGVDGGFPGNLGLGAPPLKGKGDNKLKRGPVEDAGKGFRGGQRRFLF